MNPIQIHTMILTLDMDATRDFYLSIGARSIWDTPEHMCFGFGEEGQPGSISFFPPSSPGFALQQEAFGGAGLMLCIPAGKADARCAEFRAQGIPILEEPTDRDWNWRSFLIRDPNGVVLDFFEVLPDPESQHAPS